MTKFHPSDRITHRHNRPADDGSARIQSEEQASSVTACVFDVFHNFIAIYEEPPRFMQTIVKQGDRWTPEELVEVMPKTLAAGIGAPPATFDELLMANAKSWELTNEGLREID